MIKTIIRNGSVATLAQLIGRIVNYAFPIVIVAKFDSTSDIDTFFLFYAASTYVSGTLANSATNASIPLIQKGIELPNTRAWLGAGVVLSIAAIISTTFFLQSRSYGIIVPMAVGFIIASGIGFYTGKYVALCFAGAQYLAPGLSWAFRAVVIIPLIVIESSNLIGVSVCLCLLLADFARLLFVRYKSAAAPYPAASIKHYNYQSHYVSTIGASAVLGLNPLIDRAIASTLSSGSVAILEVCERTASILPMIIGMGIIPVIQVEYGKVLSQQSRASSISKMLFTVSAAIICIVSLLVLGLFYSFHDLHVVLGADIEKQNLYAISLYLFNSLPLIVGTICSRLLLSLNQHKTIFVVAISTVVLNTLLSIEFSNLYGIPGIAGATLGSCSLAAVFLIYSLTRYDRINLIHNISKPTTGRRTEQ